MDGKLIVSSSPHISSPVKAKNIMLDVIIALIPSLIASIYFFGPRAAVVVIASVATCVIAEYICRKVMKREQTIGDLSAQVFFWHSTCLQVYRSMCRSSVVW